jgi:hypothetical protein
MRTGHDALGTAENEFGKAQTMKTGHNVHNTAENEYGCTKHENETRRPQNCRKRVRERKTRKRDPTPSAPPKTCPGAQNMKTGADAHVFAENESGSVKHENSSLSPPHRQK